MRTPVMPRTLRTAIGHTRFLAGLVSARLRGRRVPLTTVLCVTNRCNLRCAYCYGEHPARGGEPEFTTRELLDLVDGLRGLGTRVLQIQGGEPLLRPDLDEVLLRARRRGMLCDLVTNGVLIPRRLDTVRLCDRLCISLDGPRPLNDRNRGAGAFDGALEGMARALDLGVPVRLSAVLTAETTPQDVDWLADLAAHRGVRVNFSPSFDFQPRFDPSRFKPLTMPDEKLRALLRHILSVKRAGAPIQFSARSFELAAAWPFDVNARRRAAATQMPASAPAYPPCRHGDLVLFIDSDGALYPCCNFWGRPQGTVRSQGLAAAYALLSRQGCAACMIPAYIDRNLFFDMRPRVWLNYIIQTLQDLL